MEAGIDSPKFISFGVGYASGFGNFASIPFVEKFIREPKPNVFMKRNDFEWLRYNYGGQWKEDVQLPYET